MKMTKGRFDILRAKFGKLSQAQVDAINFIVDAMDKDKSITYPQGAYTFLQPHGMKQQPQCCQSLNMERARADHTERGNEIVKVNCTPTRTATAIRFICKASTRICTMVVDMFN